MERWWKIVLLGASMATAVAVSGCDRALKGDAGRLIIQAPQSLNKVGALAALPANRKVCYGVNVTGAGITPNAASCSPPTGVLAGWIEPGKEIIVSVPKGTGRKVELYIYLLPENQNLPCPLLGKTVPGNQIKDAFLVATANNITVSDQTDPVMMTLNFQGLTQHLGVEYSLPASCTAGSGGGGSGPVGFGTSTAAGEVTGTGMKMYGRVGQPQDGKVLSGAGIKLYVRE